jgi:predicted ATP-grasp superfamily ATP-dependent carboligase
MDSLAARHDGVLVLDGRQRAALAITRSLGARGVPVTCAEADGVFNLAACSRYSRNGARYTSPGQSATRFAHDVVALAAEHACRWIWPVTDSTTMVLAAETRLQGRLLSADEAGYEATSNKALLTARARALGVPVPDTLEVSGRDAIRSAAREMQLPWVLKPGRSKYVVEDHVESTAVRVIDTPSALDQVLDGERWPDHMPALLQAFVPGHGAGVFCMFDGAEAVAWFAHRRIREKPPSGGVSVLSEAVAPAPAQCELARRLLADARYRGIAMVEFRIDPGGMPYLMEINARPWGSLQLAIDAGVDFAWLQYCQFSGLPRPEVHPRAARLRWLLGDVDNLLLQLLRPTGAGSRVSALLQFLRTCVDAGARNEVLRLGDPRPGLGEFLQWCRGR